MKLSDEQREEIRKIYVNGEYVHAYYDINHRLKVWDIAHDVIGVLLSSEQAWREKAEQKENIIKRKLKIKQDAIDKSMTKIESLKAISELAIKTLEWYSDPDNYNLQYKPALTDKGKQARSTLNEIKNRSIDKPAPVESEGWIARKTCTDWNAPGQFMCDCSEVCKEWLKTQKSMCAKCGSNPKHLSADLCEPCMLQEG